MGYQSPEAIPRYFPVCLVNCYLPSGNDSEAVFNFSNDIDALNELIVKFGPTHHLVICGDLNADHCNRNGTKEKRLMNLIQEHNLLDPGDNTSTYIKLHLSHSSRIDRFFFKFTSELDPAGNERIAVTTFDFPKFLQF